MGKTCPKNPDGLPICGERLYEPGPRVDIHSSEKGAQNYASGESVRAMRS